jgi:hypothetical protein
MLGWSPRFTRLDQQINHAWKWLRDEMPKVNSKSTQTHVDLLETQEDVAADKV